jgi:uncharacterized membrane protein HdeD (DUF308 family)
MTSIAPVSTMPDARALRRLYFIRTAFSAVWVVLVFVFAAGPTERVNPATVILLVIYPLWDAVATVLDLRADHAAGSHAPQYLNLGIDIAASIGIGLAFIAGAESALGVFGAWAFFAGGVQLILGLRRRKQGGQWAMIASGAISVIAGVSFVISAISGSGAVATLAGYSLFGAVWFLIAALFLTRAIASTGRRATGARTV